MDACLYAGLAISGINGEVMPAQGGVFRSARWGRPTPPTTCGLPAGCFTASARDVETVDGRRGISATWDPKPVKGD